MREAPRDDTLEGMYKTKLGNSEHLKTTLAPYNEDTAQKNEPTSCTRLKNTANKHLDQVTKDRHPMPETTELPVELPADGKQMAEVKAKTVNRDFVDNGWQKESAPKESHAVSNMTSPRMGKGKGKRDGSSSPSPGPRSPSKDSKHGKSEAKRNVPKGNSPSGKPNQLSCFQLPERNVHETVMRIIGIRPNVSNTRRMKVAKLGIVCFSSFGQQ